MTEVRGKRVLVMGLGRFGGGIAVTRWLVGQGATVTVTDTQSGGDLAESVARLAGVDVTLKLGGHDAGDFKSADLVVASPAVPPSNEFLQVAKAAGVPVTTEICLLVERLPTKLTFGVTGTKGKSTTATLLAMMLRGWRPIDRERADRIRDRGNSPRSDAIDLTWDDGSTKSVGDEETVLTGSPRRVWLGGNIGGSLLASLPKMRQADFVVLELSSYMLHYLGELRWSPHVALVTMVEADHTAWHGDVQQYHEAKQNIVRFQTENDFAVLPTFSKAARDFKNHAKATVIEYGKRANLPESFAPRLPGKHNRLNERGAYTAAKIVGVYPDEAQFETMDFLGLPHRLQMVAGDVDDVRWVNDSIATIPQAAVAACEAFPAGTVIQIVGGSDKGLPLEDMAKTLAERCKAVLCIGEMGSAVAELVGQKAQVCGDLTTAAVNASLLANVGDVVLLSPGFASYDQFANFEKRGETFASLAQAFSEEAEAENAKPQRAQSERKEEEMDQMGESSGT